MYIPADIGLVAMYIPADKAEAPVGAFWASCSLKSSGQFEVLGAALWIGSDLKSSEHPSRPSDSILCLQQSKVDSLTGNELGVCSHLHHAALVDDGDAVSRLDGGQSVSDDDARASLASLVQRSLHDLHVGTDGSFRCSTCWVKGSLVAGECNFPGNQTHAEFEISTGPVVHLVDDH